MFYDITQKNIIGDVFKKEVEFEVENENGEKETHTGENVYFLEALSDEELRELNIAKVARVALDEELKAYQTIEEQSALNTQTNIYTQKEVAVDMPLTEAKAQCLMQVNDAYEANIEELLKEHIPQSEMLTFETQERESRAYLQSKNESDAPTMKLIAENRGVALEALCTKAVQKATLYRQASATLIGKRQGLQDRIEQVNNIEDLRTIKWEE